MADDVRPSPALASQRMASVCFRAFDQAGLAGTFGQDYFLELLEGGWLAADPEIAYSRLAEHEGCQPEKSGKNCASIRQLRTLLRDADPSGFPAFSLMITAPHTHWSPGPIIESYDRQRERYWIGPQQDFSTAWPISFVLKPGGPHPYEWAEAGAIEDVSSLERTYGLIDEVSRKLAAVAAPWKRPFPLGLSVNHRFKRIGGPALCSTMEIPDETTGLSYVVRDTFDRPSDIPFAGQVGWPVHDIVDSTPGHQEAGEFLDEVLASLTFDEARQLLADLERQSSERWQGRTANAGRRKGPP